MRIELVTISFVEGVRHIVLVSLYITVRAECENISPVELERALGHGVHVIRRRIDEVCSTRHKVIQSDVRVVRRL